MLVCCYDDIISILISIFSALFSNTDWAYGIVVYAGQETKIQLNSLDAPSKMSKLEQNLNTAIIIIFIAQISLVTMSVISIYALGYQYKHGENQSINRHHLSA